MGQLLQFPTGKIVKNSSPIPELTEEQHKKLKEDRFVEQLTEKLSMDILSVLQDNVVHFRSDLFLKDLALIIESIKSLLKRDFGTQHPMQSVADSLITIITSKEGKKLTDINYNKILRVPKAKVQKKKEEKTVEFESDINLD
jgi:hypothetical protein